MKNKKKNIQKNSGKDGKAGKIGDKKSIEVIVVHIAWTFVGDSIAIEDVISTHL